MLITVHLCVCILRRDQWTVIIITVTSRRSVRIIERPCLHKAADRFPEGAENIPPKLVIMPQPQ